MTVSDGKSTLGLPCKVFLYGPCQRPFAHSWRAPKRERERKERGETERVEGERRGEERIGERRGGH